MERPHRRCVTVSLHNKAKNLPVGLDSDDIGPHDNPREIARRWLSHYYAVREHQLVPLIDGLVPDEVVLSERGKVLGRWNVVDEMNARFSFAPVQ